MKNNIVESVVRETLRKRYIINENFNNILESESNDDDKFDQIVTSLSALSDEGMSDDEIETDINEGIWDFVKQYVGFGNDKSSDASKDTSLSGDNLKQKAGSGVMSQLREWLIRKALGSFGFTGALSDALAATMADLDIKGLVQIFRGKQGCETYGDDLADAVIEGIAVYLLGGTEQNSMAFNMLRNVGGEYLKSSDIGERVANAICDMAYKMKK